MSRWVAMLSSALGGVGNGQSGHGGDILRRQPVPLAHSRQGRQVRIILPPGNPGYRERGKDII